MLAGNAINDHPFGLQHFAGFRRCFGFRSEIDQQDGPNFVTDRGQKTHAFVAETDLNCLVTIYGRSFLGLNIWQTVGGKAIHEHD